MADNKEKSKIKVPSGFEDVSYKPEPEYMKKPMLWWLVKLLGWDRETSTEDILETFNENYRYKNK